ncbi:hypothetical protein [Chengkuizengella marina]|uniref:Uncharacterized protein n=1 Tax=Chengkuizengella marina TaxID=2507566 RepID=A0A6N9Q398_9BACL|nr:hypothetical protein [Chengkuizengella marina]NBI29289.1 hypothetical protein [Chengkuizengella marina]
MVQNQEKPLQNITQKLDYLHQEIHLLKNNLNEHYFWALKMSKKIQLLLHRAEMLKIQTKK